MDSSIGDSKTNDPGIANHEVKFVLVLALKPMGLTVCFGLNVFSRHLNQTVGGNFCPEPAVEFRLGGRVIRSERTAQDIAASMDDFQFKGDALIPVSQFSREA